MFLSPPSDLSGGVASVEVPPGKKYVTFRASGVGSVTLLQDHKCVPHMTVHKMDLEVGLDRIPPPTPLYLSPNHIQSIWEGNPVFVVLLKMSLCVCVPRPDPPHPTQ